MSNYFVTRDPTRFGQNHHDFLTLSQLIVAETAESFKSAAESKKDLITLFHETIANMGLRRNSIAVAHKSHDSHLFGVRRDIDPFSGICPLTSLITGYKEYNDRVLAIVQAHLRNLNPTPRKFERTEIKLELGSALNRCSTIDYALMSKENESSWDIDIDEKTYKRICSLCGVTPISAPYELKHFSILTRNKAAMQTLKRVSIDDYKRIKNKQAFNTIDRLLKHQKSDWVVSTLRLQVDNKMVALTQNITTITRNRKDDPVDAMTGKSIVTFLHQDPFLIETMLTDIAKIFKEAIEWQGDDIRALKDKVALIQYEFAHAMPFKRGSAAIGEWLERSIYRYHGFDVSYNPDKSVNLEALILPLGDFINNYDSMLTLEKLT